MKLLGKVVNVNPTLNVPQKRTNTPIKIKTGDTNFGYDTIRNRLETPFQLGPKYTGFFIIRKALFCLSFNFLNIMLEITLTFSQ